MIQHLETGGIKVYVSGVSSFLEKILEKTSFYHEAKMAGNVFETSSHAIEYLGVKK